MRGFALLVLILVAFVLWKAEVPSRLDEARVKDERSFTEVHVPEAEMKPAPPEPEEKPAAMEDPLAALAPESFQSDPGLMDTGFGTAFSGGGPALSSSSGTSQDIHRMVREQTSVDRRARVTFRGPLDYPAEARNRGLTGTVTLRIRVSAAGLVEDIQVAAADPPGVFDTAALGSVRGWRFEPAFTKGVAIASTLTQKIRFEMN